MTIELKSRRSYVRQVKCTDKMYWDKIQPVDTGVSCVLGVVFSAWKFNSQCNKELYFKNRMPRIELQEPT